MITWWMDRYRGKSGLFGWLVFRADLRWIKRMQRVAKQVAAK